MNPQSSNGTARITDFNQLTTGQIVRLHQKDIAHEVEVEYVGQTRSGTPWLMYLTQYGSAAVLLNDDNWLELIAK